MAISFTLNGTPQSVSADPAMPLLWILRDVLGLTGTKYGCGAALCGACTVWLDGKAARSCAIPLSACAGHELVSIEGLGQTPFRVLQEYWIRFQAAQCGYCQSGALMAAAALLASNPAPDEEAIRSAIGNLCRCGTYQRMRTAIVASARALKASGTPG